MIRCIYFVVGDCFIVMTGSKSEILPFIGKVFNYGSGLDKGGFYCFGESQSFVFCVVSGLG